MPEFYHLPIEQLQQLFLAAERLGHEGVHVHMEGDLEGRRLVVIVGVAEGADHLMKIIEKNSTKDPRSA